jgi:hypothetical protein
MAKKRKAKKTRTKKTKMKKTKMKKAKMKKAKMSAARKHKPTSQANPDVATPEPTVTYTPPIPTEVAATSIPESPPS